MRVLVFDDDALLRNYLRQLFANTNPFCWVGEVTAMQDLIPQCIELQPDLLLIGGALKPFVLDLPATLQQVAPQLKIVVLLPQFDPTRTAALLATKPAGCLLRQEIAHQLLPLLHSLTAGETAFSRAVAEQLRIHPAVPLRPIEPKAQASAALPRLSRREQEILHLLAQGLGNKAIARALGLTENTIEQYLKRLYRKLNVRTRVEAVTWFLQLPR